MIKKGASLLRKEGFNAFLRGGSSYLHGKFQDFRLFLRVSWALIRGEISLSLGNTRTRFVAEDRDSVKMTIRRFKRGGDTIAVLIEELDENDVFYDIGANTGLYTGFAAHICEQVVAFEPHPANVSELRKNAILNGPNVSVFEVALSDHSGSIGLYTPEVESSHYPERDSPGFGGGTITEGAANTEVKTVPGDRLIAERDINPPNVVKIDVEGAEPLVIDGLSDALSNDRCRFVDCEVHRSTESPGSIADHNVTEAELFNRFEEFGFDSIEKVDDLGNTFVLRARRTR